MVTPQDLAVGTVLLSTDGHMAAAGNRSLGPTNTPLHVSPRPVLRCLGIPTRVVTNYNSAHDQNSNLLIEYFRNEFGEVQGDKSEMIW